MSFSLRSISSLSHRNFYTGSLPRSNIVNIRRGQISPPIIQRHEYHSWGKKALESLTRMKAFIRDPKRPCVRTVLETITGMKMLNEEETKQAIIDHQKLWVAHYSIHNHAQVHEHYKMFYSMQLFTEPKDFSVQEHYIALIDKEKEKLSSRERQEVVDLYQFAIDRENNVFISGCLKQKLKMYLTPLEQANPSKNT